MRIVTLELDPDASSSLNRTLRLAGYHNKGHSTGDTLRRTLRAGAFDLAILDWDVEDVRDNSMLDLIHRSLPFEWQVIFVISGSEDKKALQSLRRPYSYLVKPMLVSSLLARVRFFLQHLWPTEPINNEMQFGPYRFEPACNAVAIDPMSRGVEELIRKISVSSPVQRRTSCARIRRLPPMVKK